MKDKSAVDMMERCKAEIQSLRNQIRELAPKADAYESFQIVLRLFPKPSQAFGEDIVWLLNEEIKRLNDTSPDERK